jgi:hypothetical protein
MTKGDVSKAFWAIVSDAKVLSYSLDGLQFLQSKNPAAIPGKAPWNWDEEYIGAEDPILITFEGAVKLIRSAPKQGCIMWSGQFPRQYLEITDDDSDQERIPHGHPALPRSSSWVSNHRIHSRPVSTGILSRSTMLERPFGYDRAPPLRYDQSVKPPLIGKSWTWRSNCPIARTCRPRSGTFNIVGLP